MDIIYTVPLLTVQMLEMFDTMGKDNYSVIVGEIERHTITNMYGAEYEIAGKAGSSKIVFYDEQNALMFKLKFAEHISATQTEGVYGEALY